MSCVPWKNETERADYYKSEYQRLCKTVQEYRNDEQNHVLVRLPVKPFSPLFRICPLNVPHDSDDMTAGNECQRCPYLGSDCMSVGAESGASNIVTQITAGDEAWVLRRKPYFGSVYFTTKESAEDYLLSFSRSHCGVGDSIYFPIQELNESGDDYEWKIVTGLITNWHKDDTFTIRLSNGPIIYTVRRDQLYFTKWQAERSIT